MTLPSPKKYTLPLTQPHGLETTTFIGQLLGWSDVNLAAPQGAFVQIFRTDRKICTHMFQWEREDKAKAVPRGIFDVPQNMGVETLFEQRLIDDLTRHLEDPLACPLRVIIDRPYPMVRAHRLAGLVAKVEGKPCSYSAVMGWDRWDWKAMEGGVLHLLSVYHGGPLAMMEGLIEHSPRILIVPPQHWQAVRIFQQVAGLEGMKVFVTDRDFVPSPFREALDCEIRQVASQMIYEPHPLVKIEASTNIHASPSRQSGPMWDQAWARAEANFPGLQR